MEAFGHYLHAIPGYPKSISLLSTSEEVDTAVVFVHGFWGDAHGTWQHFPLLIDACANEYPWWNKADAHFYDYPGSSTTPIAVSANRLLGFISYIFPQPNRALLPASQDEGLATRRPDFRYKHLVLVGHSEGCVIIRRALVAEYKLIRSRGSEVLRRGGDEFLENFPVFAANVVLFAPAHLGASVTGWRGVLLSLLKTFKATGALVDSLTSYDELKKDSPILRQLQADTEAFAIEAKYCVAFVAQSHFGARDRIVYIGEYGTDPCSNVVQDEDHSSICKPTATYRKPLKYVYDEQVRRKSAP